MYNVAPYLDDFIASVEAQTFPLDQVEVVMVDDGSTDDSGARLKQWQQERPDLVRVISQPNAGVAAARNAGTDIATGTWITYTDPDDVIEPDYLEAVAGFIRANPSVQLVGTNRLMYYEETDQLEDNHPLRTHFLDGDRLRDLRKQGDYFFGSAPCAFVRRAMLREHGIRFDPRVRPNFEDGHFCGRYLLAVEPLVGFVKSARYHYRKRAAGTSQLQGGLSDPSRYSNVLRHGYLALFEDATRLQGSVPAWLQSQVVYDLSYYLSSQEHLAGLTTVVRGDLAEEFHGLMAQICSYLDPELLERATARPMHRRWRDVFRHAYGDRPWHAEEAFVKSVDERRGLVCVSYHFTGDLPREEFLSGGLPATPSHAKIRDLRYHDRVLLQERILWFPSARSLRIYLDGRDIVISDRSGPRHSTLRRWMVRRFLREAEGNGPPEAPELTRADRWVLRLARSRVVRRYYGNAWVLVDRLHDADDSGERLFRHLREHRRGVNAWFVLEKGVPDWDRLRRDGYKRLVPFGSLRWKLLMLNCRHLISSHADEAVIRPPALRDLTDPTWRFVFLQHGVIKDDLSVWLNRKPIDLFVTSTQGEFESIVGDHTPYVFTTKETVLTGLPRFDRLREIGARVPPERRDLVLVAPTWRQWLAAPLAQGSQRREAVADFVSSDFVQQWLGFLNSPELREACLRHGLKVGFLPHPNLQPVLPSLDLPDHVQPLTFAGNDVQEFFARAAVLVTDYSSVAFNAAYIDRPVVYFQFDADRMFGGDHVGQAGYFTYERDGYGPVVHDLAGAVAETVTTLDRGRDPAPEYAARIAEAFPQRDGQCCERVVRAIRRLDRPVKASRKAPVEETAPVDVEESQERALDPDAEAPAASGE